jgi:hypothetical protein
MKKLVILWLVVACLFVTYVAVSSYEPPRTHSSASGKF